MPLLHSGKAEKQARESGTRAVVKAEFGGVTRRKLVEAAILKETPHRPDKPVKVAAELHRVPAMLPRVHVAYFEHRVPGVHRRRGECVADPCIALHGKPRRAPSVLAPKTDPRNSQLAHDVIYAVVLRSVIHRQPRHGHRERIHLFRCENVVP